MAAKAFTAEEKDILRKNPNVEIVEKTRIIYTEEFKVYYMKNYLAGKKPTEIFVSAGFDPAMLGNKRIERASARWRKSYADGSLKIDVDLQENKKVDENMEKDINNTVEETKAIEVQPVKKRRGRPRKNAVAEEKEVYATNGGEQQTVEQPVKKRRGRPRKNPVVVEEVKVEEKETVKPKKPRKKRVNKIALMAQSLGKPKEKAVETEAQTAVKENGAKIETVVQPQKKRRGRPRKNPIVVEETPKVEVKPAEEQVVEQPVKKRRGRPRKNPVVTAEKVVEPAVKSVAKPVEEKPATQAPVVQNTQYALSQGAEINPTLVLAQAINNLAIQLAALLVKNNDGTKK